MKYFGLNCNKIQHIQMGQIQLISKRPSKSYKVRLEKNSF